MFDCLFFSLATDTTKTTFCETGFDPQYAIMFGVFTALFFILCIALVVVICFVILKKDEDLLSVARCLKEFLQESKQENSDARQTAKAKSDSPVPSESMDGDQVDGGPKMKNDTYHGTTKSSVRKTGSTEESDYKSSPDVYSDVKKVLKRAELPKRKYKMVKKELKK